MRAGSNDLFHNWWSRAWVQLEASALFLAGARPPIADALAFPFQPFGIPAFDGPEPVGIVLVRRSVELANDGRADEAASEENQQAGDDGGGEQTSPFGGVVHWLK